MSGYKWGCESPEKSYRVTLLMVSYKQGYKSPNMGYNYSYLTYNPTYNYQGLDRRPAQDVALVAAALTRKLDSQARGLAFRGLVFRVWSLGFSFRVWGLGFSFRVWGLVSGFGV